MPKVIALLLGIAMSLTLALVTVSVPKTLAQRIGDRSFPSVFQAWNGADNLAGQDPYQTVARHDLAWFGTGQDGLMWNDSSYAGLGTAILPASLATVRAQHDRILHYNPNMVLLAEVRYRTAPPNWLPADNAWWARDKNGNRIVGWAEGGYYLLDWHNPTFRAQVTRQAKALSESGIFDGIMLDEWDDNDPDRIRLLREIRDAIGEDKLIIVNHNATPTPNSAPYINGLFMESCFWSETTRSCQPPSTPTEWQQIAETLLWAETNLRAPRVNALETWYVNSRQELNRMRATTTLALTHSNGYVLFSDPNDLPTPDHLHDWYSFWDYRNLGKPRAAMIKRGDGSFQREFEGGTVIYNPLGNGTALIHFAEPRLDAITGRVSTTFELAPLDGDIYLTLGPVNPRAGNLK